ncbi:MAG: aminotransferase class IV [Clostridium sp.]
MEGNINGNLVPVEELKNIINSKNKMVYEVIRIIDTKPLFLNGHLERLYNSISTLNINVPFSKEDISKYIINLSKVNNKSCGNIKLIIDSETLDLGIYFIEHIYPTKDQYLKGVDVTLFNGERHNPNAKIINSEFRKEVDVVLENNKAYEAILVNNSGHITEGSKSNIFMIKDNIVYTAPVESVLPGVTRKYIIDMIRELDYKLIEKYITVDELLSMDSMFICGTSPKILPIHKVDQVIFNSNKDLNILKLIYEFDKVIKKDIAEFNISI